MKTQSTVFLNVLSALFLREIKTRFGYNIYSFLWIFIEPLLLIGILSTVFYFANKKNIDFVPFELFISLSVLSWNLFLNIFNKVSKSIHSNTGILMFPQIKVFDIVIVRFFIEILLFAFFLVFFEVLIWIFYPEFLINDIFLLLINLFFLSIFSLTLGIFNLLIVSYIPSFEKINSFIIRFLFFISTIFFPLAYIPEKYQYLFLYNPLVIFVNNIRYSQFSIFEYLDFSIDFILLFLFLIFSSFYFLQQNDISLRNKI